MIVLMYKRNTTTPVTRIDTNDSDNENIARKGNKQENDEDTTEEKIKRYQKERSLLLDKEMSPNLAEKEEDSSLQKLGYNLGNNVNSSELLRKESLKTSTATKSIEFEEVN